MGLGTQELQMLLYAAEKGVDFKNTLMVGRQHSSRTFQKTEKILKAYDPSISESELQTIEEELERSKLTPQGLPYAEAIFRYLAGGGGIKIESIDYSDYEKATIIHDMCTPVPEHLKGKFSFVIDSGTLEHVFDYPTAIKNCMEMVRPGGHLLLITPANNYFGHGFYQFSPELFYSLLTEQNGYSETQVFIQDDRRRWYRAVSPQKIRRRVDSCIAFRDGILIHVLSRRVGEVPARLTVLQSDYVTTWNSAEETPPEGSPAGTVPVAPEPLFRVYSLYRSLPIGLRKWLTPVLLASPSLRRFLAWRWAWQFYEPCNEISSCTRAGRAEGPAPVTGG